MFGRFYFDNTKINGYWCIKDRDNKDAWIWIDCPKEYLEIIVEALNRFNANRKDGKCRKKQRQKESINVPINPASRSPK